MVRVLVNGGDRREGVEVGWAAGTKDRERAVAVAAVSKVRVDEFCCCLAKERDMDEDEIRFMDMISLMLRDART
jgi:hypothetical protein